MENYLLNLREIRQEKHITQKQLSTQSGIAQSYICELENGKYDCSISTLCTLCKALKVTPNDLIKKEYWD